jgi:tetratricopeptide (TPR) repeat protein
VAVAFRPDDANLRLNRGGTRLKRQQFAAAEADFTACIARDPARFAAHYNRSVARREQGNYPGALADLAAAEAVKPDQVRTHFHRSRVLRLAGDAAGAAAALAEALKWEPTDAEGWVSRAFARRAEPAAAVADLDRALALDPDYLPALQTKADVLAEELKQPAAAAAALTRMLEVDPGSVPALRGRAVMHARLGDRAKAHADAEAALARDREPVTVYMVAGAYALLSATHPDDRTTALRLLTEALRGGFGFQHLATDPELAPLQGDPDFERVVAAARRLYPTAR